MLIVLAVVTAKPCDNTIGSLLTNHHGFVPRLDFLPAVRAPSTLSLKDLFGNDLHGLNPPREIVLGITTNVNPRFIDLNTKF